MNDKNTLTRFFAGLALMIVGLFILFNRVHVGPAGWGGWGRFTIGNFSFPSGLVMVPFIIGVVWMFGTGGNLASKIFTAFSVLLILAAIIMNAESLHRFSLVRRKSRRKLRRRLKRRMARILRLQLISVLQGSRASKRSLQL